MPWAERCLLAVMSWPPQKIAPQMLRLLTHHRFSNNRYIKALFVGHSGDSKVNVNLLALFLCFSGNIPLRHGVTFYSFLGAYTLFIRSI